VTYVTMSSPGTGYTSAPLVEFTGGGGAGAAGYAVISLNGAPVASVGSLNIGTVCYDATPAVSFIGGGGVGATATTTLAGSNSCIQNWTINGSCNSKRNQTISGVGLSGGGGSGFSSTLVFDNGGNVTGMTIQNPGDNYTSTPTSISGISGCPGLTFTANLGKRISTVSLVSGGGGYTSAPTVSFTTGTGTTATQPTAVATLGTPPGNAGEVTGVIMTSGGSGYTSAPVVSFTGGGGTGAAGIAGLGGGTPTYRVGSITVDDEGRGYTTDPAVSFTGGGGGSGATAVATLGRGGNYGKIYLLTALAETRSGARSMLQMEVTTPVTGWNSTAALTLDGPNPILIDMPNSTQFYIDGNDANSCGQTAEPAAPAIGAYDDPNAQPATHSVDDVIAALPRPDHYVGEGGTPSVKDVYGTLGDTLGTPLGLKALIDGVRAKKTNVGNTVDLGTASSPAINYIDGDLTMSGNPDGYGILVVTGTLVWNGDFAWHGVVLVVGDGIMEYGGGGTGTIYGTVLVAKIWDDHVNQNLLSSLGSPTIDWDGGGGNGIYYDHCWATNMMSKIPFDTPPSTRPLKILSLRSIP
jgi:hypothetical protein